MWRTRPRSPTTCGVTTSAKTGPNAAASYACSLYLTSSRARITPSASNEASPRNKSSTRSNGCSCSTARPSISVATMAPNLSPRPYANGLPNAALKPCTSNMELFTNGHQAQQVVEHWRNEYNEQRPHSSLDSKTPAEFAAHYRNSGRPTASPRSGNGEPTRDQQQPTRNPLTPVGPQNGGK